MLICLLLNTRSALTGYVNNETMSNFNPNSSLVRKDADVSVISIDLDALYSGPVDDLLYQASTTDSSGDWISDNPVGVMGCTEQHRFCDAEDSTKCTDLNGFYENGKSTLFTGTQGQVAGWLYYAIQNNFLWHMVQDLGEEALGASLFATQGFWRDSSPLPNGQWENEAVGWHQFIMARMQKLIVQIAAGPQVDSATGYTVANLEPYMEDYDDSELMLYDVCKNVKIRDSSFYSWNVIGVVVIIVVGVIIIATSLFLEPIVSRILKRTKRWRHKREDWIQDHVVHLQRHAYEKSVGHVSWKGHEDSVPTTEHRETFASLSRHSLNSVAKPAGVYSADAPTVSVKTAGSPGISPSLAPSSPTFSLRGSPVSNGDYFQTMPPR